MDARDLLRAAALDPELAALLWLLLEDGVPLVVAGPVTAAERGALAAGLLSIAPGRAWVVVATEAEEVTPERLSAHLRGGVGLALTVDAPDLEGVFRQLTSAGLPEDGVRRLGVVVVARQTAAGLRLPAVHYLRPSERDGRGHIQRRPPAVLATWDEARDAYEHYAWGITPELADRVDRSQADLESRQAERALFLAAAADDVSSPAEHAARIARYLAHEPPRTPAPTRAPAGPPPFSGGLLDPDPHRH